MSSPAVGFSRAPDVRAQQADEEQAQAQVDLALEDLAHGAFTSAGYAIRNALKLVPRDEHIQRCFHDIERHWREHRYQVQNWRDAVLNAELATRAGDMTPAALSLIGIEQADLFSAPSASEYLRATELKHAVQGRVAALEGVSQIAASHIEAGRKKAARAICARYLPVAPEHEWLTALARKIGMEPGVRAMAHLCKPLSSPEKIEAVFEIHDTDAAQAACANWEIRQEILDAIDAEPDLVKQTVLLRQAGKRFPGESLFGRELELLEKRQRLQTLPKAPAWVSPAEPKVAAWQPPRWILEAVAVCATFACTAALTYGLLLHRKRASVAIPSAPVRHESVTVARPREFGVALISRVSVSVFMDFKPLSRVDDHSLHTLPWPKGDHVLSVGHGNALLHLFTKVRQGAPAPELHNGGLSAVLISQGHLAVTDPRPQSITLDGRALSGGMLDKPLPIGPGPHELSLAGQPFTFEASIDEPLILIAAPERKVARPRPRRRRK